MLLSEALNGYLLDAKSRRLSPSTIADYSNTFRKFSLFVESSASIEAITPADIRRFLASLEVSGKTARNCHVMLTGTMTTEAGSMQYDFLT